MKSKKGSETDRIVQLAAHHAIPAIYPSSQVTEAGGLMSYEGIPHPIEGRSIEQRAGVPVVDVFLNEFMTRNCDLLAKLHELAINCSFLLLRVGAHAGVQCGLRHTW
jgi:hypothetical protein